MERSNTWDYYPLGEKKTQRKRTVKLVEMTNGIENRPMTYKLG